MISLKSKIEQIIGSDNLLLDEPMSRHTTFKIGGVADYYAIPQNVSQIKELLQMLKTDYIPYYIIGNGSNLLVSDKGYRGVIIQINKNISSIRIDGNRIIAEAGNLLSKLSNMAYEHSLTGLEFAGGIPGTLGGAVCMNAGAYGGEIKNTLIKATVLNDMGEIIEISKDNMQLGYRTSIIMQKNYIVLAAEFELADGNKEVIKADMEKYSEARREKQPLEYPSAGSTFKRPDGYYAGKLIMDAGLRGYSVGGAAISDKHCGFVINKGKATAAEVITLVRNVQKAVYMKFEVNLELEVRLLGEF